jgi:hypothetical protein
VGFVGGICQPALEHLIGLVRIEGVDKVTQSEDAVRPQQGGDPDQAERFPEVRRVMKSIALSKLSACFEWALRQ